MVLKVGNMAEERGEREGYLIIDQTKHKDNSVHFMHMMMQLNVL